MQCCEIKGVIADYRQFPARCSLAEFALSLLCYRCKQHWEIKAREGCIGSKKHLSHGLVFKCKMRNVTFFFVAFIQLGASLASSTFLHSSTGKVFESRWLFNMAREKRHTCFQYYKLHNISHAVSHLCPRQFTIIPRGFVTPWGRYFSLSQTLLKYLSNNSHSLGISSVPIYIDTKESPLAILYVT